MDAEKDKGAGGAARRALAVLLSHGSLADVRAIVRELLADVAKRMQPLLRASTWVALSQHPLTRHARRVASQAAAVLRAVLSEVLRNAAALLWLAQTWAARRLGAARRDASYDIPLLFGAFRVRGTVRAGEFDGGSVSSSLADLCAIEEGPEEASDIYDGDLGALPSPPDSPRDSLADIPDIEALTTSPKHAIRSLCSASTATPPTVSPSSPVAPSPSGASAVPPMWRQGMHPDDISKCAAHTPACRSQYVDANSAQDSFTASASAATSGATAWAASSANFLPSPSPSPAPSPSLSFETASWTGGERTDCSVASSVGGGASIDAGAVVTTTPSAVSVDMAVYSTGTPFRETVQSLRESMHSFADEADSAKSNANGGGMADGAGSRPQWKQSEGKENAHGGAGMTGLVAVPGL